MRLPIQLRISRGVILIVVAFVAGMLVSAFILGQAFYMRPLPSVYEAGRKGTPPPTPPPAPPEAKTATWLEVVGRQIIYTAHLSLRVESVDAAVDQIKQMAEASGGYVADASISHVDERKYGRITIRVPQESFYQIISQIEALGTLESKDVNAEYVTEQYIDLKARLSNLQRQEQRLLEILDMCTTVKEILEVEEQLERVRGEIERITGQLRYLERRVEYSTITVYLTEITPEPWVEVPKVDWGHAIEAGLWGLFTVIQATITFTIAASPFVAILVPAYYLYQRRKKSQAGG